VAIDVEYGRFVADTYAQYGQDGQVGARMILIFQPSVAKCRKIAGAEGHPLEFHLIQIVREDVDESGDGGPTVKKTNAGYAERAVPAPHACAGWGIDMDWQATADAGYQKIAAAREAFLTANGKAHTPESRRDALDTLDEVSWQLSIDAAKLDPLGGRRGTGSVLTSLDPRHAQQRISTRIPPFTSRGQDSSGNALVLEPPAYALGDARASLRDNPSVPVGSAIIGMRFQTTALLEYGPADSRRAMYLGVVGWGWHRDPRSSTIKLDDFVKKAHTGNTAEFQAAITHWNGLSVDDPAVLNGPRHRVLQLPPQ